MKLKNISFISLALLSGVFATNCTDDIENFSNKIFMTESDPSTVLIKPTSVEESHEFTLSIPKPEGQDVTFTIAADASLVSASHSTVGAASGRKSGFRNERQWDRKENTG